MEKEDSAPGQDVATDLPPTEVLGPESGELLILGWGGTYGAIRGAVNRALRGGD